MALRQFSRGALLAEAGAEASTVFLIRRGQARVYLLHETGRETTTAVLGAGQVVGLAPLLGLTAYHAFVEALTDLDAWAMPARRLQEHLPSNAQLLHAILLALGQRLALSEGLVRDVALLPMAERLPDVLGRLQGMLGGDGPRMTHELLGGLVGARRETVSRVVGQLQMQQSGR